MGISIQIKKYKECNEIGYYVVSTQDFGGAHFHIGINKSLKKIYLYSSKNCDELIGEIDCAEDTILRSIANIPVAILGRVVIKAMKVFDQKIFPDFLSYEA